MSKILLVPLTAYKAGDVELWDLRRVAVEYGVSKVTVRDWQKLESFPKAFAMSEGGKTFYEVKKVRAWAEDVSSVVRDTLENKARGVGRPSKNRDLVRADKL
jgi:uncharacterized protein YjcR